jgi:hypothetical protein
MHLALISEVLLGDFIGISKPYKLKDEECDDTQEADAQGYPAVDDFIEVHVSGRINFGKDT